MQFLFRLAAHLPLSWLHALGGLLGWVVYAASPTYRRRFRDNTARAAVARADARRAVAAAGRLATELPWLWLRPPSDKAPLVHWEGESLIDHALAGGRGLILLSPHVGCFEVVAQAWAMRMAQARGPMTVLYRPSRLPAFDALVRAARSVPGLEPAPTTLAGVRVLLKSLRQGRVVGLLPDQVPPQGMGVWAPFFGAPAYTMTLAARLARQTGAPVLLAWGDRLEHGAGYVVRVEPVQGFPADGLRDDADPAAVAAADALALNQAMEGLIRRRPGAYLWGYARFKQPRAEL